MATNEIPLHYVCTLDYARELVASRPRFWLSNCGCREARGGCARSRVDVCLYFVPDFPPTGEGHREVSLAEVEAILEEAERKRLVARPFRGYENRSRTEGICFCCDDCCGYFLDPTEKCDKGDGIEETDAGACEGCGVCVEVCHFGGRRMDGDSVRVRRDQCYGCGLCADVCPQNCIGMIPRYGEHPTP